MRMLLCPDVTGSCSEGESLQPTPSAALGAGSGLAGFKVTA